MTIEEIEKEWWTISAKPCSIFDDHLWLEREIAISNFAEKYSEKLIAVAKAAKAHVEWCGDVRFIDGLLEKAIEELEK